MPRHIEIEIEIDDSIYIDLGDLGYGELFGFNDDPETESIYVKVENGTTHPWVDGVGGVLVSGNKNNNTPIFYMFSPSLRVVRYETVNPLRVRRVD